MKKKLNLIACLTIISVYVFGQDPLRIDYFGTKDAGCICSGEIVIDIKGGVAPYTYAWSNGVTTTTNNKYYHLTDLCPSNYSLTITDATSSFAVLNVTIGTNPNEIVPGYFPVELFGPGLTEVHDIASSPDRLFLYAIGVYTRTMSFTVPNQDTGENDTITLNPIYGGVGNNTIKTGFILKYDVCGVVRDWTVFGPFQDDDNHLLLQLEVLSTNNVVIAGRFNNTIAFTANNLYLLHPQVTGKYDLFMALFNEDLNYIWRDKAHTNGDVILADLTVNQHQFLVTGLFDGPTMTFPPSTVLTNKRNSGNTTTDVFVARFNDIGNIPPLQWATSLFPFVTTDVNDHGMSLVSVADYTFLTAKISNPNSIPVTRLISINNSWGTVINHINLTTNPQYFECRDMDFYFNPSQPNILRIYMGGYFLGNFNNPNARRASVARINVNLSNMTYTSNFFNSTPTTGNINNIVNKIALNDDGDFLIAGNFGQSNFTFGNATHINLPGGSSKSLFVSKINSSFQVQWMDNIGTDLGGDAKAFAIARGPVTTNEPGGLFYLGGWFTKDIDFDGSSLQDIFDSQGNGFIARFDNTSTQAAFKNLFLSSNSELNNNLSLYPNPATDQVFINSNIDEYFNKISIRDITGRLVYSAINSEEINPININLSDLKNGLYLITAEGDSFIETFRLVVQ